MPPLPPCPPQPNSHLINETLDSNHERDRRRPRGILNNSFEKSDQLMPPLQFANKESTEIAKSNSQLKKKLRKGFADIAGASLKKKIESSTAFR